MAHFKKRTLLLQTRPAMKNIIPIFFNCKNTILAREFIYR